MNKKTKLEKVQGILFSLILVLTGFQNLEFFPYLAWINILLGSFFFSYSIIYLRRGQNPIFKILMISSEGIALLFAAYMFFAQDKKYLPYAMLLAAAACFTGAVIMYFKQKKVRTRSLEEL